MAALGAAVRARDGRGPRTAFEQLVPAHFGLSRPQAVTRAMYYGRISEERVRELAPVVFAAAAGGDAVARGLLDRQADELARMAIAMIRRVGLARHEFDVVLAGGVFQNHDEQFIARLTRGIRKVAPGARLAVLHAPPLLGAALLGLDRLELRGHRAAERRLRAAFAPDQA
jgi:N-acetylglucosamine kinase-like BadF-type ATPase